VLPCPQVCHLTRGGRAGGGRPRGPPRVQPLRERSDGRGGGGRARALLVGEAGRRGGERGGRARLGARLALRARLRPFPAASQQLTASKYYDNVIQVGCCLLSLLLC